VAVARFGVVVVKLMIDADAVFAPSRTTPIVKRTAVNRRRIRVTGNLGVPLCNFGAGRAIMTFA